MTIATSMLELFVVLVSGFQPLTNFTENSMLGVTVVLSSPLEYYDVF